MTALRGFVLSLAMVTAFVAGLPLGPSLVAAQPDPKMEMARERFGKGENLYARGRFEEALREYEAAFEAAPLPELLFNIGQCHRNLEHYDAAIFSFRKYLRLKPDAENRVAVEKLVGELEAARDRQAGQHGVRPVEPVRRSPGAAPSSRRWWLYGGVATVAAAAVVTGVLLWPSSGDPPLSDLGNVDFSR